MIGVQRLQNAARRGGSRSVSLSTRQPKPARQDRNCQHELRRAISSFINPSPIRTIELCRLPTLTRLRQLDMGQIDELSMRHGGRHVASTAHCQKFPDRFGKCSQGLWYTVRLTMAQRQRGAVKLTRADREHRGKE